MIITVKCTHCSAPLKLKDRSKLGKKIACPKCGEAFVLAEDSDDEEWGDPEPAPSRSAPPRIRAGGTRGAARPKVAATSSTDGNAGKIIAAVVAVVVLIGGGLFAAGVFKRAPANPVAPADPAVANPAAPATAPGTPATPSGGSTVAQPTTTLPPAGAPSAQPKPAEPAAPFTPPVLTGAPPAQGDEAVTLAEQAMKKCLESMAAGDVAATKQLMQSMLPTKDQCYFLFGDFVDDAWKKVQEHRNSERFDVRALAELPPVAKSILASNAKVINFNVRTGEGNGNILSVGNFDVIQFMPDRYPVIRIEAKPIILFFVVMENNDVRLFPLAELDFALARKFKARQKAATP